MDFITSLVVFISLIALSGFFSGAETALISLDKTQIIRMVKEKKKGARIVEKLRSNPKRLLITILLGNNLVNICASAFATFLALRAFGSIGLSYAIGIVTFLILIFGEIFPKNFAAYHNEGVSCYVALPIEVLQYAFLPVTIILEKFTSLLLGNKKEIGGKFTEDEIKIAIKIGVEKGVIDKDEKKMMDNVLRFNDIPVESIMVPFNKMVLISSNKKISDIAELMIDSGFSRIPVYKGKKSNIIGVVNVKTVLFYLNKGKEITAKDLVSPVIFVNGNRKIDELFEEMNSKREHLALVVGRKGEVKGLITLEDLLEEIVGEIYDETDLR